MDIQVLKEFILLAEEKSFTTASEKLYIAQSVLTKHIQKLEDELDVKLFVREIPLKLTPSGQYVYDNIKPLLNPLNNALDHTQITNMGYTGTLSLGIPFFSRQSYYRIIRRFERLYPSVKMSVSCQSSNDLLNSLIEDKIDIAVLYTLDVPDTKMLEQFTKYKCFSRKLELIVNARDDRFRDRDSISISEIQNRTFMVVDNQYYRAFFKNLGTLTSKYGITLKNIKHTDSVQDSLLDVALHDAITILPGGMESEYGKDIRAIPIEEPEFTYSSFYVWTMTNKNTAIIKFIERMIHEQ